MNTEELENEIIDAREQIAKVKEWVGCLFIFILAGIIFITLLLSLDGKN